MPEYRVWVENHTYGWFYVKAQDENEALSKASAMDRDEIEPAAEWGSCGDEFIVGEEVEFYKDDDDPFLDLWKVLDV